MLVHKDNRLKILKTTVLRILLKNPQNYIKIQINIIKKLRHLSGS